MDFEINKQSDYTLIKVLSYRLDTTIAPDLKSELVVVNANGERNQYGKNYTWRYF